MNKCLKCGCEINTLTSFSHGVCLDCSKESVTIAKQIHDDYLKRNKIIILENLKKIKLKNKLLKSY